MTERRSEAPTGANARGQEGNEMSNSTAPETTVDSTEIVVRPAAQSFHDYIAARVDIVDLSSAEIVELTFAYHAEWQSSDERKAEREQAKFAREAEAAAKRATREQERKVRLENERAALEAKLAKLAK
jgi:hypothetical protein